MNYSISYQKNEEYEIIIHSVSYINPIYILNDISKEIKKSNHCKGKVLFDLLLTNGNEFNRFAECSFNDSQLDFNSIKIVQIEDIEFVRKLNDYYVLNKHYLNDSNLTAKQKADLLLGKGSFCRTL